MKSPLFKPLIDKSVHAAIAAIEVYNKPDFRYREESFSILMLNAWELLLKARLLKEYRTITCLYEYENVQTKKGLKSKHKTLKRNRLNNPLTISAQTALKRCIEHHSIALDASCRDNVMLLMEIRDSAIHFLNSDSLLSKKVYEIGTASLRNYLVLARDWFSYDLSKFNFYLMPLSFLHEFDVAESFSILGKATQLQNLLGYISETERTAFERGSGEFAVTSNLKTSLTRSTKIDALKVDISNYSSDPNAVHIHLAEENILERYPWKYDPLMRKLVVRYSDFKRDVKFNNIMRVLQVNRKFCYERLLYPDNAKSQKSRYYSSEIFKEFDKHYKKN